MEHVARAQTISGAVEIRWTINGGAVPSWDNKTFVSGGCGAGTVIEVRVTNSSGSAADQWRNRRSAPWQ